MALHLAARERSVESGIMALLLDKGAAIEAKDYVRRAPRPRPSPRCRAPHALAATLVQKKQLRRRGRLPLPWSPRSLSARPALFRHTAAR